MSLRFPRLCLATCLAAALTAGAQAQPPPAAANAADPLVGPIKLPDSDIDTVLGALEIYTGRSILRPQALPTATYNLKIDKQIPKSEAILAIETILELNGIGIVPMDDNFMKAVSLQTVRTEAPLMITGSSLDLPPSSRVATKIFMLNFLRVNELVQQIQGMLTPGIGGALSVVQLPNANAALITDTVTNLQRIESLLKQVDQPVTGNLEPKFYILKNGAKASDLVARINAIVAPLRAQLGTATTFTADDRTNQIILIAHPAQHALFDSLIAALDVKADPNTRNEVIPLMHALATDVSTLLTNIVGGQAAAQRAAQSVRPGQGIAGAGGLTANGVNTGFGAQPQGFQGGVLGGPGGANPAAPVPAAPVAVTPTINFNALLGQSGDTPTGSNQFSSLLTVQPDVRSNAIVVSGTADDVRLIKDIVAKIDVLLAQVRIEVIVAEVTLTDTDRSGISALGLTVGTDTPATGDGGRGTHITGFNGTLAGWAVTSGVVNPLAFQAAFSDAGSRNNVKVISAPTIVTTHSKQGEVIVGESIPVITSITSTPSASATATNGFDTNQSVSFKDINLDLKVTPFIGNDGSIQLTIDQLIQDQIGSVSVNGNAQPIIGTRHATSTINVYDQQMIVLGGLQRSSLSNDRSKLGFIYEIPILSNLFGDRTKINSRTELLLFIRPHVLPATEGTADTIKTIDTLSNKQDVKEYLKDPSKAPKEGVIEQFK
jgi:general secretion pathway protein D